MSDASNLGAVFVPWQERLARHARGRDRPWLLLPKAAQRGAEHEAISYRELNAYCGRIRGALGARGISAGERVLVLADNSAESVVFMLAALSAGVAIVPLPPAELGCSTAQRCDALRCIVQDCAPRLFFDASARADRAHGVELCNMRQLLEHSSTPARIPAISSADLAIIQYTSGTTERARGVALTHGNVVHNIASIAGAIGAQEGEVGVSWLPMFHDMGLIGVLLATFAGLSLALLRPRTFYLRPEAWLWAVSRYGAHYAMAPNAAYQLCADKIAETKLRGLDLSRWRVAFNGADLIHPKGVHAFAQRFAAHGFRAQAMFPVYGLAENTLAATLPEPGRGPCIDWVDGARLEDGGTTQPAAWDVRGARGVVAVGRSLPGQRLRVVAPDTGLVLGERQVGEIQLTGPSTTRGYWSSSAPRAHPLFSQDGWLCTGDRGYLVGGTLHVLGRYRSVAKRFGRKIDCGFVAAEVLRAVPIRADAVAVFGSYDEALGSERLIVAAEAPRAERSAQLSEAIAAAVRGLLSFSPDEVVLLPPGSIPRTTSGKIRHAAARERYQEFAHERTRS